MQLPGDVGAAPPAEVDVDQHHVRPDLLDALRRASPRMADEQAALRRVATLVARRVAHDLVFAAVARELGQLTDADITGIFRFESDGTATLMGSRGLSEDDMRVGAQLKLESPSAIASVQATGESARYDVDGAMLQRLPDFLRDWGVRRRLPVR